MFEDKAIKVVVVVLIELIELSAGYGDTNVINNLNLGLDEGEIVALIGHNGAGKTTTLLSIIGDVKPRKGKVMYKEENLTGQSPSRICRNGIAFVPQSKNVFSTLTVYENLLMGIYMGGQRVTKKSEKENVELIYDIFPILSEKRSHRADSLSGGQRQMLALGMAIISKPSVLLLDEPSTGLAPVFVEKVLNAVKGISTNLGMSVIIVEQNVGQVLKIADRVNIIKLGGMVYEGKPGSLSVDDMWSMF